MATIGVKDVEIRIYKADQLIVTLTTDVEGRASTMLEADTYRAEYWYEGRKIGEYTFTLEVDSYVFWAFPAILMAVVRKLLLAVEVESKLGDVMLSIPLAAEVEAKIPPEFYPSLDLSISAKLVDVELTPSLVAECTVVGPVSITNSLTPAVEAKLGDVVSTQSLVETVSVA